MILDTSALVAILFGAPEADTYLEAIHAADRCRVSAGTFLELSTVLLRQAGPATQLQCDLFFRRAGISIAPFTAEQAYLARQAFYEYGKGRHPAGLNLGDCFAYGLAKATGEPLLFTGDDFRKTDVTPAL